MIMATIVILTLMIMLHICIYIYIYICVCMYVYIYIYIYYDVSPLTSDDGPMSPIPSRTALNVCASEPF